MCIVMHFRTKNGILQQRQNTALVPINNSFISLGRNNALSTWGCACWDVEMKLLVCYKCEVAPVVPAFKRLSNFHPHSIGRQHQIRSD